MIKIEFSEAQKAALHHERFHHPHPRVQQKMEVLWLKSQGVAHQDICRLAQVNGNTLVSYLHQYEQGGIERLKQVNFRGRPSQLRAHRHRIEAHLREHPPATINEACAKIAELTGIRRSATQVRLFLKDHCGMKRLKTGVLPAKVDPVAQEAFKKKHSNPSWLRPRPESGHCFSLTPPILSWVPLPACSGAGHGCGCERQAVANASMCWAL